MEGLEKIERVKGPITWDTTGNKLVDRANTNWTVKVDPEALVSTATVKFGNNGIQILLTFNTETFVVCDDQGVQKTITAIAFQPGEVE